jgi:DNA polymerase I
MVKRAGPKPRRIPTTNQIALISDLPEHGGKGSSLKALRAQDHLVVINPKIIYVQSMETLRECAFNIRESREATIDTETRGLKWALGKKAVSLNIYTPNNDRAYFIPTRMVHAARNFEDHVIQETFEEVLADPEIKFIGHNFCFDMHFTRETWNMEVANFFHDTMLASRILNENEAHGLDDLCVTWLGVKNWKKPMDARFEVWPIRTATQYAGMDALMTYKLYEFQKRHFASLPKLESLFYDWEMPTARKAYHMERTGVCYDLAYHEAEMKPFIVGEQEKFRARIYEQTGPINLESNPQLASALFETLGLPQINENHVDLAVLSELKKEYPIASDILEYRSYSTINKMFVNMLPQHVVNGRIHCTFNTLGAKTGRMSCSEPNLQQLPKRIGPIIRRAIVPSPGCVFVTMDYSQMELRLLAHFSNDKKLIQAFKDGVDIHTAVMCTMLGVSYEEYAANKDRPDLVAKRVLAKTVNFGVLYGMGYKKLAWKTGSSEDVAKEFIDKYFSTYPGIKKFIDGMKLQAYKEGYVETLLGRKRRLPDCHSLDKIKASLADREAVNSPIQGSVSDMMKMTGVKHDEIIIANSWPYELLLQIHDEFLFEVPELWLSKNRDSLEQLQHTMANVFPLRVPIEVNVEILSRWGDKTIIDFDDDEEQEVA